MYRNPQRRLRIWRIVAIDESVDVDSDRWRHGIAPPAGIIESFGVFASFGARDRRHERLDDLAVLFRRRPLLACPATPGRIPDADMDGRPGGSKSGPFFQQATVKRRSEYGASKRPDC